MPIRDIERQVVEIIARATLVPVERLPKDFLEPVMSVFMGPGGHAVCYYLRGGKVLNFAGDA